MQRNLKLYPWFQACASLHFWLPMFFLYFASVLTVEVGRRPRLLIAGAA